MVLAVREVGVTSSLGSGLVLHMVAVVTEVVLEPAGQRQVLDPPGRPIDGDAAQVLQGGRGRVDGPGKKQLHGAVGRGGPRTRTGWGLGSSPGQLDVVLHQVDHAVKLLEPGLEQNHRVQLELAVLVLDAQVGGSGRGSG